MNKVELLFQGKGIYMYNIYVYPKQIAIEFIKECKKNNINVLGIDAFIVKENFHQPSMADSIDLTSKYFKENKLIDSWDYAARFLEERDEIYYFEIVCAE